MRKRILTNYIVILILSALITGALAFYFIKSSYISSKEEKLHTNINLIENLLRENYKNEEKVNFYRLAQDLSTRINSRVTFIDITGWPIADSINNSIIFNNHSSSQEFRNAMKGERTIVKRYSGETGEKYFYLAIPPIKIGDKEIILRLGDSYGEVDHIAEEFISYLLFATLIGVCFAILISYITVGKIVKPIKELTEASKHISEGNFDNKIIVDTKDEIEELSVSFNQMARKLKYMINELKDTNATIISLEKMRKDFVANVSHELRTPLTSIGGFVETLRIKELDEKSREKALDIIEFETERLKGLINELLILSKIESVIEVKKLEKVPIYDEIYKVLKLLEPQIRDNNINVQLSVENNLNMINGDKDLFRRILINLIENSIKYNKPEGNIKIDISNYKKGIQVIVEDSGIGIPEEDIPWIFERFYRVSKSRANNKEGSGLGLAIVKQIVLYFGGDIELSSELGKGTKFIIKLPN